MHARLHAHDVADVALHALINGDQHVDRAHFRLDQLALGARQPGFENRRDRFGFEIRRQFAFQFWRVFKRIMLGLFRHEEIKWVDHRHVGDQIDSNFKFRRMLGEN